MASAEKLLHDAQYAFHSISFGEEAYASNIRLQHRHVSPSAHHAKPAVASQRTFVVEDDVESLDWGGLIAWLFMLPKLVLGFLAFAALILFSVFGPFLLLPLIAFVVLTSPFRKMLKPEDRKDLDSFVARTNESIAEHRESGGGML